MCVALLSAVALVVLHLLSLSSGPLPAPLRNFKSAVPLIAIGFSYISLIATVRRTLPQRLLGFAVGTAFILWGAEQFLHNQTIISMIDDFVVFLFVFDLSLVVRSHLRAASRGVD